VLVHILTDRAESQNSWAFLAPLRAAEEELRSLGIVMRYFYAAAPEIEDCDVLVINSKFWSGDWSKQRAQALPWLEHVRNRVDRVIFFDRASSAGVVVPDIFPFVDQYLKTTLYADRRHYGRPVYGARLFAEYYNRRDGVSDDQNLTSKPLAAEAIAKLGVSWNTGLANYGFFGSTLSRLYRRLPLHPLLRGPFRYAAPGNDRPNDLSCRITTSYSYETVAWQRKQIVQHLAARMQTSRISRLGYFRELSTSKVVLSPFGYSEINYKDFEAFVCGCALVKPDMSHLETWPDYFVPGETYVPHAWDLSDLDQVLDNLLAHPEKRQALAAKGQATYRRTAADRGGREQLAKRFRRLCMSSVAGHAEAENE
jgi:hypothetical protein